MNNRKVLLTIVALVLLVCCLGVGPCTAPTPAPPTPTSEGAKVAAQFVADYAKELAAVFREAGELVKQDKLISDVELLEHLQAATETARKRAAEPIGVLLEKRLPNGEIASKDAAVLFELAEGLEGIK